jgi:hypothetical protein
VQPEADEAASDLCSLLAEIGQLHDVVWKHGMPHAWSHAAGGGEPLSKRNTPTVASHRLSKSALGRALSRLAGLLGRWYRGKLATAETTPQPFTGARHPWRKDRTENRSRFADFILEQSDQDYISILVPSSTTRCGGIRK